MFLPALTSTPLKKLLLLAAISTSLWHGLLSSASAQDKLSWTGADGATWNSASNWTYLPGPAPSIIPNSTTVAYFSSLGAGNTVGNLGANQSAQGLTFEDLTSPFTIGSLAEAFTLALGTSGISLLDTAAAPVGIANTTINSNVILSANQSWINQTIGTLTTAGNVTLGADLFLIDNASDSAVNTGGSFVIGSAGKVLQNSGGSRTLRVGNTGVATELFIASDVYLTESTTVGRRLTFNVESGADVVIDGNILNGGTGAAASGLTRSGTGTLTINGNLAYTLTGTAAGTDSGTVITGGAGSVTTINGDINNATQHWTITGGASSGTTPSTILNIASSSVFSTGTWVVGSTTRLNFTRNGTTTLNTGAWDVRTDGRITADASTTLTGTTGAWTFGTTGSASTTAQISIANANNLTTGNWSFSGSGVGNQVILGNVTNLTTGAWTFTSPDSQVNWTGSGTATVGAITMGAMSGVSSSSINLSSGAILNLNGNITSNISGSQSILGGTLNLNAARVITVNDSTAGDDLTISSTISDGTVASGITKAGNGTLVLSGTNTFTGTSTLAAGRLTLDHSSNNSAKLTNITLNLQGAILELRGNASANSSEALVGLNLNLAGSNTVRLIPTGSSATTLNAGAITRTLAGRTAHFEIPANSSVTTINADTTFIGNWATIDNGVTDHFAAISGGQIVAISTFTADNLNQAWAPTLTNQNLSDSLGFTGTTDYMSANSLRISGANALTVSEKLNLASGGLLITSGSTSTGISGGILTAGLGNELVIHHHGSQDFTISSSIQRMDNSSLGGITITKAGEGTLVLSGKNFIGSRLTPLASSGTVQINEGILAVTGGNAISDNTAVVLDDRLGATLQLRDNETIGNLETGASSVVDLGSHTLTLRLSSNSVHAGAFVGDAQSRLIKDNNVAATSSGVAVNFNMTSANDGFLGTVDVNGGLLQFSTATGTMVGATSFTLNRWGSLLLDNNTTNGNRIGDTATIVLNGANGAANANQNILRGLWTRTNQGATLTETVGNLVLRSGSNYFINEATGGVNSNNTLAVATISRENYSTFTVRGTNLGTNAATGQRTRLLITTTGNVDEVFGNSFRVGGAFANGATLQNTQAVNGVEKNISIVPWMIGEVYAGGQTTAQATPGNSFVTYNASWGSAANLGFRPLHLTNEYSTYDIAASTDNVRVSLTADLASGAGKTINSLVINNQNNAATVVTVTGTGTLNNHTGAFLFTSVGAVDAVGGALMNATTGGIVFNQPTITTGSGEYLMFANNVAAAGTTINANLTSTATLTKSGIGLLTLTGDNTALTDIFLNEGTLRISDLDNIGGNTGGITFAGGTLELGTTYTATDHLTSRPINVIAGNEGRLFISQGKQIQIGNISATDATFIKAGGGALLLSNGALVTAKQFIVEHNPESSANLGVNPQLILNNDDGVVAINGNLQIGSGASSGGTNGTAVVHLDSNEQIVDTAVISFNASTSLFGYFSLMGYTETVAGIIAGDNTGAMIQNVQDSNNTLSSLTGHLILSGTDDYYYGGRIRDYGTGSTAAQGRVSISKTGSGTQTLAGATITYTGATTVNSGLLRLRDTTAFASAITNNATVEIERTNATPWTYSQAISGTGDLRKTGVGAGATILNAANTYSGITDIDAGTLTLSADGSINNSRAINIKSGATFDISAKTAPSGYDFGQIVSGGGTVTGNLNLTAGGSLRPGASSAPSANITTGDQLGALSINGNLGLNGGGTLLQISAATLTDAGVAAAYAGGQSALTNYLNANSAAWNSATYTSASGVPKHDFVNVTGSLTWNTGSTITYTSAFGYVPTVGDVLNLWDWASLSGTYNLGANANFQRSGGLLGDLELPDIAGILYDLSLFQSHGIAVVVMVPEPSRALLLLIGLAAPFFLRRRRIQHSD